MAQLNDTQIEIISKYKQDLRRGNLKNLIKSLLSVDPSTRGPIISYMIEHGIDILSQMDYIPYKGIVDCTNTIISIPGNIKRINKQGIINNSFKELLLEEGIEKIEPYAIVENSSLEKISLPESLTSLGQGSFANNSSLKEVFIPDSIKVLPKKLFEGCDNVIVTANYRSDKQNRLRCVESEIPWYKEHLKWIRND